MPTTIVIVSRTHRPASRPSATGSPPAATRSTSLAVEAASGSCAALNILLSWKPAPNATLANAARRTAERPTSRANARAPLPATAAL